MNRIHNFDNSKPNARGYANECHGWWKDQYGDTHIFCADLRWINDFYHSCVENGAVEFCVTRHGEELFHIY